ncbi:IS21 family transposase [Cellulomonas fengjieae]|uniref:IS21 family transposase n=1 Tax=Cellulomonas fengjieae TaxID=2819978 RepID=A0ABS3SED9_9CELL|nr:IS21 family transposase [Cellulomonas fengjieae]MBO3084105.1 IS21 family transposase [Cellulomonas fengjieae]QVI64640.1 IS21 family transposase [Cellulomonas fengjieae]
MIGVEDWAEVRRLRRVEGMAISAIARRLGIARNTVKKALASDRPPKYERPARGSLVDEVEPQIRGLLVSCPTMPATVIAQRIGWARSLTILKDRVRVLRPYYLPPDPATRTTYEPGHRLQCDLWFPPVDVPLGAGQVGSPPVLVMVSGYSRMMFALMLPSRQAPDLIAGHWALLQGMGAVARELVWDNESAVGSWRAGKPKLTEEFEAFRGVLGIGVHQCRPRDPEAKGLVERANGFLETSFLPGRVFTGPDDFNAQLAGWLPVANARQHRALGCRPVDRWSVDRDAMLVLPPVAPQLGWRARVRLPRDHYVRLGTNDYSVDPVAVGRFVDVLADMRQVTVRLGSRVVAVHERSWARWQTFTDQDHKAAALAMSHTAAHRPPASPADEVEQRDLSAYDAAFGVTEVA